jgi:hypothetical protein
LCAGQWKDAPFGTIGLGLRSRKGSDPSEWPADLRVRQVPGGAT